MNWRLPGSIVLLLMLAGPAEAAWVLGPEAEPGLRAISAALQADFMEGAPGPIRVEGGQVTLHVRTSREDTTVLTLTRDAAEQGGEYIQTKHGYLSVPKDWSQTQRGTTQAALNEVQVTLPWLSLEAPPQGLVESDALPKVAPEAVDALTRRRRAVRDGRDRTLQATTQPSLDDSLAEDNLVTGNRGEPHRWVQASLRADQDGRRHEAIAYADVSTRMAPSSAEAIATWQMLRTRDDTPPLWPVIWSLLGFIIWLTGTYLLSDAREDRPRRLMFAIAVGVAFISLLVAQGRAPEEILPPPALPDTLEAPLAGLCEADPALWTNQGVELYTRCGGEDVSFLIAANTASDDGLPHVVDSQGATHSKEAQSAHLVLRRAVSAAEAAGFRANAWAGEPPRARQRLPATGSLDRTEAAVALSLILLGVLICLWMQGALANIVWQHLRHDRPLRLAAATIAGAWVVVHLALPGHMVMEYTGYDLTARLAWLDALPRYGAGASWLYGWAFQLFGMDHVSLQWANRLFGILTLLPVSALLFSLLGRQALWGIALYACLPVVWRDHVSEGIMTGTTWLLASGLAAAACSWRGALKPGFAPLALAPWLAATVCRPEVGPALIPIALGLSVLQVAAAEPHRRQRTRLALFLAALGAFMALWPHLLWLLAEVEAQQASTGIHSLGDSLATRVKDVFLWRNLILDGPWVSPAVLVWLGAGLWLAKGQRLWTASLLIGTLLWWAITSVDLPDVSIPRVHIPTWLFLVPILGAGAAALSEQRMGTWVNRCVGALVAIHALWTMGTVLGDSNAEAEERLIRAALSELPPDGGCLATVRFPDAPAPGSTQRHFPDYLFDDHEIFGLTAFSDHWPECTGRSIALLGTRCYMTFRRPGEAEVPTDGEITSCKRFRERYVLEPIAETEIPNRTDFTFPMYPNRQTLPVGLYRVNGDRGRPGDGHPAVDSPAMQR